MRELARFDTRAAAESFSAALTVDGIEHRLMDGAQDTLCLWVIDEAELPRAKALLKLYEEQPDDPRFAIARKQAGALQRERSRQQKPPRVVSARERWRRQDGSVGPVSIAMMGLMLLVFILTFPGVPEQFGSSREAIVSVLVFETTAREWEPALGYFRQIRSGELWRLVTPIFVHAEPSLRDLLSLLHFLFNFGAFRYLAPPIEQRNGSWFFLFLSLAIAVLSNTAQYLMVGGNFLGMSGVVYGHFGYLWLRGQVDPTANRLPSNLVFMALLWMGLGFLGTMNMANWAHLGGLLVGAAVGAVSGLRARR